HLAALLQTLPVRSGSRRRSGRHRRKVTAEIVLPIVRGRVPATGGDGRSGPVFIHPSLRNDVTRSRDSISNFSTEEGRGAEPGGNGRMARPTASSPAAAAASLRQKLNDIS